MKAFLLLLFLLAILGGITYYNLRPEPPEFPVLRQLVNSEGKNLEVVLVGKEGDTIHFNRYSDKKRFSVPIASLSEEDRAFIESLPEQRPPKERVRPIQESEKVPPYIQNRRDRIVQIQEEQAILQKKIRTGTMAPTFEKEAKQKIKELYSEIKSLELAIEEYKTDR